MASAESKLRDNLYTLEEILGWGYEARMRVPRTGAPIRVAIGRTGEGFSTGEGATLPVALDRALEEFEGDLADDDPALAASIFAPR